MQVDDVQTMGEDDTCEVYCECGRKPFVASENIFRCACGRGYRTGFKVYHYEIGEVDPAYKEMAEIRLWQHSSEKPYTTDTSVRLAVPDGN